MYANRYIHVDFTFFSRLHSAALQSWVVLLFWKKMSFNEYNYFLLKNTHLSCEGWKVLNSRNVVLFPGFSVSEHCCALELRQCSEQHTCVWSTGFGLPQVEGQKWELKEMEEEKIPPPWCWHPGLQQVKGEGRCCVLSEELPSACPGIQMSQSTTTAPGFPRGNTRLAGRRQMWSRHKDFGK